MSEQEKIRRDAFDALRCLYIAVDSHIADDVNEKVKAYIQLLEDGENNESNRD